MKIFKQLAFVMAVSAASVALTGCDFMHDDLPDCAVRPDVRTTVRFVYDHNTSATDRFGEQVGAVTLYVCDADGRYIAEYERTNASSGNSLKDPDFCIDLDLQPGNYKVYALAVGNHAGYEASLRLPGAKFRRSAFGPGDRIDDFRIHLDHDNGLVKHGGLMLDTLWTTLAARELNVPAIEDPKEGDLQQPDVLCEAVIPLMRVTNHLTFSFHQSEMPGSIAADQYEIWIESATRRNRMNIHGNYTDADRTLRYEPFKTWTGKDADGNASVFAEFGLARVMFNLSDPDRAKLCIRNKATDETCRIDLLPMLAVGNQAFAQHGWSDQEYLDREYEFELHETFDGMVPKFGTVYVNILGWSKRVQNSDLY